MTMTDDEIRAVAAEVLQTRLRNFGFKGAEARSETDFDGSPVIRISARYDDASVPTSAITQSLHDIRTELLKRGEERFVLLEGDFIGGQPVDEDVD
jgi:hypothetical protein